MIAGRFIFYPCPETHKWIISCSLGQIFLVQNTLFVRIWYIYKVGPVQEKFQSPITLSWSSSPHSVQMWRYLPSSSSVNSLSREAQQGCQDYLYILQPWFPCLLNHAAHCSRLAFLILNPGSLGSGSHQIVTVLWWVFYLSGRDPPYQLVNWDNK